MPTPLARRALRKAVRIMGNEERLRAMLDVPAGAFLRWLSGDEPVPEPVIHMLFDFLSDMENAPNSFILSSEWREDERRGSR